MSEIEIAKFLFRKAAFLMDPPYQKAPKINLNLSNPGVGGIPDDFLCGLCHKQQDDPRVLPCFHSFCLSCLQQYQQDGQPETNITGSRGNVSNDSTSTGYGSEIVGESNWIRCPACDSLGRLPHGGIPALLPHYVLQHRILLSGLNDSEIAFYCDLCTTDVPAISRCAECLINICTGCLEIHSKQPRSSTHMITALHSASIASSINPITAVKRHLMCSAHPDRELTLFCSDCQKVVCRSCCTLVHRGHVCAVVDHAAKTYTQRLRERLDKARHTQRNNRQTLETLNAMTQRIEVINKTRCAQVETEIDKFIEGYIVALEEHRKQLRAAVAESKATKLRVVDHQREVVTKAADRNNQVLVFGEDLLAEGTPGEFLMFAGGLLTRLESTLASPTAGPLPDVRALETINFLPEEKGTPLLGKQVFGVVTTQRVSPVHSSIQPDGMLTLNNARQQQTCEVVLISRDADGQPMCHGGDYVTAKLSYRDMARRFIPVDVRDCQDGTYVISFTPDAAGNMALTVAIKDIPVQGSPYPVCVRTLRPHQGTFHCCSFCSSSGKKYIKCGCGGTMPGGYKGCGHGHVGHPGRRHWSCCGNILHNSECGRPTPTFYHLTL